MALFYQHTINENTKLGIWRIEENESFFLNTVPLQQEISHPHKRLQHLAGRYLLQYMFPDFPYDLIKIADTRKPFLTNEAYHFSISHCGDFAAAIVSRKNRVGVDIEQVKPMIQRIRHKFLSEDEMKLLEDSQKDFGFTAINTSDVISSVTTQSSLPSPNIYVLTLAWSAKEAIYKWHGNGGLDFKKHMQLKSLKQNPQNRIDACYSLNMEPPIVMNLVSQVMDDLVLTYVVT